VRCRDGLDIVKTALIELKSESFQGFGWERWMVVEYIETSSTYFVYVYI
jgi:hypothetical protein